MYNTILRSTNSGKAGIYGIGKTIETGGTYYTIRSAFEADYPNGSKPILTVCTYEFAKKRHQKPKYSFHLLHKYPNQLYFGYADIPGTTAYINHIAEGKIGYELKTNHGLFQVVHEFELNGRKCFVGSLKRFAWGYLEVLWYNPDNDKYYKYMYTNGTKVSK